ERVGVQPEPGTSFDEMISKMQLALTVTPSPGSNTLQISYLGRSPERSARMVNAITDVYLDEHNRVYRNEGISRFYHVQIHKLRTDMKASQRRMREYVKKQHVVDIDQEIQLWVKEVVELQLAYKSFQSKMIGTEQKLKNVQAQVDATPAQIPYTEETHPNPM